MDTNIILVGLNYEFIKQVSLELCNAFDMFYLDMKDLIAYNLQDEKTVIDLTSVEYYEKQINKLCLSVVDYENTIINLPYDLFLKDEIYSKIKNSATFIFVNIDKKNLLEQDNARKKEDKLTVALLAYEEVGILIKNKCHYDVNGNSVADYVKNIKNIFID